MDDFGKEVDETVGRLCVAIGRGDFKDEVTRLILKHRNEAFELGVASVKPKKLSQPKPGFNRRGTLK